MAIMRLPSKFPLGKLVWTRGVNEKIAENPGFSMHVLKSLKRHANGDWGEIAEEDRGLNERALVEDTRIFSVYEKEGLPKIWIITEADRSVTTVLFPDEY